MSEEAALQWYEENSKKLGELNVFLQKRNTGLVGEHVIDVVMDHVKHLEKRNIELNKEIGGYAEKVGQLSHYIEVKASDLNMLATRMCIGEGERNV